MIPHIDWAIFGDMTHYVFEAATAIPPALIGWWWGHRKHDAKKHPGRERMHAMLALQNARLRQHSQALSLATQRLERLEASLTDAKVVIFDPEGQMGL